MWNRGGVEVRSGKVKFYRVTEEMEKDGGVRADRRERRSVGERK